MNVLVIGVTTQYMCNNPKQYFKRAHYTTLDANRDIKADRHHDINEPMPDDLTGKFDAVFASHVLEHIGWRKAVHAVANMAGGLRKDGELYVFVPDLEWACQKVIEGNQSLDVIGVLYGGQMDELDNHKAGYTAASLQMVIEKAGLRLKDIRRGYYTSINYGRKTRVPQLLALGVKV